MKSNKGHPAGRSKTQQAHPFFKEGEHPRRPAGTERGGEFAAKGASMEKAAIDAVGDHFGKTRMETHIRMQAETAIRKAHHALEKPSHPANLSAQKHAQWAADAAKTSAWHDRGATKSLAGDLQNLSSAFHKKLPRSRL